MKKLTRLLILASLVVATLIIFSSCNKECEHDWKKATCTKPKTCWNCDETTGEPKGHDFIEATCTEPQKCLNCDKTEGKALEHDSKWREVNINYRDTTCTKELYCNKCKNVIKTKTEPLTTFVNNGCFSIYPDAFVERFEESSKQLNDIDYCTSIEYKYDAPVYYEDNYIYYRIQDRNNDYSDIGLISCSDVDGNTIAWMNGYTANYMECINILVEDSYDVSAVVYATILAIDPGIDYNEAAVVGQEIVDNIAIAVGEINVEDFQGINYNGINYLLYMDRKYHYFVISIA